MAARVVPPEYSDGFLELSKAKAAPRLLEGIDNGDLDQLATWGNAGDDVADTLKGWWEYMCYGVLREALDEAEQKFAKAAQPRHAEREGE